MALKLHSEYGFSYGNLKVLLGGWFGWQDASARDPQAYPIEVGPGSSSYRYASPRKVAWGDIDGWLSDS